MTFRHDKYPAYKANRDNRTKVQIHTYKVAGGWSGVIVNEKETEALFTSHVRDNSDDTDQLHVLLYGLRSLCIKKQLRAVVHKHHQGGDITVNRLS